MFQPIWAFPRPLPSNSSLLGMLLINGRLRPVRRHLTKDAQRWKLQRGPGFTQTSPSAPLHGVTQLPHIPEFSD